MRISGEIGHAFRKIFAQPFRAQIGHFPVDLLADGGFEGIGVVGHSYGGSIALAMAARNPPKVKAFVSLGGVTSPYEQGLTVLDPIRLPLIGRGLATVGAHLVGQGMVRDGMTTAFSPNETLLTEEIMKERLAVFLQTKVLTALAHEAASFNDDVAAIGPGLSAIAKPLHFIHGGTISWCPLAR